MCNETHSHNWGICSLMCMLEESLVWLMYLLMRSLSKDLPDISGPAALGRFSCFLCQNTIPSPSSLIEKVSSDVFENKMQGFFSLVMFSDERVPSVWPHISSSALSLLGGMGFAVTSLHWPALIYPKKQFIPPFAVLGHFQNSGEFPGHFFRRGKGAVD